MREREIERYLVAECRRLGILCYKFVSPQRASVPDRILIANGLVVFLELKAPGKLPTEAQEREMARIVEHGGMALHVNTIAGVNCLLNAITNG